MQKSDKAQVCNSSSGTLKKDEFVEYSCNRPDRWKGRYVFITIPDKEARLSLCEVNIYAVFESKCYLNYGYIFSLLSRIGYDVHKTGWYSVLGRRVIAVNVIGIKFIL